MPRLDDGEGRNDVMRRLEAMAAPDQVIWLTCVSMEDEDDRDMDQEDEDVCGLDPSQIYTLFPAIEHLRLCQNHDLDMGRSTARLRSLKLDGRDDEEITQLGGMPRFATLELSNHICLSPMPTRIKKPSGPFLPALHTLSIDYDLSAADTTIAIVARLSGKPEKLFLTRIWSYELQEIMIIPSWTARLVDLEVSLSFGNWEPQDVAGDFLDGLPSTLKRLVVRCDHAHRLADFYEALPKHLNTLSSLRELKIALPHPRRSSEPLSTLRRLDDAVEECRKLCQSRGILHNSILDEVRDASCEALVPQTPHRKPLCGSGRARL